MSALEKQSLTFADRFSHIKQKIFILFWLVLAYFFIQSTFSTLLALYSITKMNASYFTIEVLEDKAFYKRVDAPPASWTPLTQISKKIQGAIISSEDGRFYLHPGYDLEQLRDAIFDSFVRKKKMRGASTITQQLVKNLFLKKEKTFGRKIQEFGMALMLERYADKKKILEAYLNVIEYGKGIYGIKAATLYYFHKHPSQVTAREAAFLAMLLPSPKKYSKSFSKKQLTPFARKMVASILLKMRQGGIIGEEEHLRELNSHFFWERVIVEKSLDASENKEGIINDSSEDSISEETNNDESDDI
ncbi:MAG: monofunctional biosynthetic peptidoglycan transglycosylase [Bacteriovorax sp.]|nr:monofunctional biosynthetic peptidoglycan transglycosylase [Bacteriovorax sp.]